MRWAVHTLTHMRWAVHALTHIAGRMRMCEMGGQGVHLSTWPMSCRRGRQQAHTNRVRTSEIENATSHPPGPCRDRWSHSERMRCSRRRGGRSLPLQCVGRDGREQVVTGAQLWPRWWCMDALVSCQIWLARKSQTQAGNGSCTSTWQVAKQAKLPQVLPRGVPQRSPAAPSAARRKTASSQPKSGETCQNGRIGFSAGTSEPTVV
jgi:hypothetical protein